jgi:hypothetical protein
MIISDTNWFIFSTIDIGVGIILGIIINRCEFENPFKRKIKENMNSV